MLNLLTLIFTSNNYSISLIENEFAGFNAKLAMPRDKASKQEYFLILQHDEINDRYSQEELNSLVEIIGEEKPTSSYFNDLINSSNGEVFESFKKNELDNSNRHYPLLMRIITKLPIIHYISNETELEDLEKIVRKKFTEDENELLDSIMQIDLNVNQLETAFFGKWR